MLKYFLIPLIAIGMFLLFAKEYSCSSSEMLPYYYGSPFIHMSTSQASSLTYDYYIAGFIGNLVLWSLLIMLIRYAVNRTINSSPKIKPYYSIAKALTIFCACVIIGGCAISIGDVTWSCDLDEVESTWNAECQ